MPGHPLLRWTRAIRPEDVVWVLLFLVLAVMYPSGDLSFYGMLAALASVQVLESKAPALASPRGRVLGLGFKFLLCFLLIGYTGGVDSPYWPVLLLPVVSAASFFGLF